METLICLTVNVIEISFGLSLWAEAKNTTEQAIKTKIRIFDINSPLFSQKKKGTLFFSLAPRSLLLPCRERSEAIVRQSQPEADQP
jgi:hypothetical protein